MLTQTPLSYAAYVLHNLATDYVRRSIGPFYLVNEFYKEATGHPSPFGLRALTRGSEASLAMLAAAAMESALHVLTCVASLGAGVLPALLRGNAAALGERRQRTYLYLWLLVMAIAGSCALVRIESRFLLPVLPAILLMAYVAVLQTRDLAAAAWRRSSGKLGYGPQL
jgi:hypothetical protein